MAEEKKELRKTRELFLRSFVESIVVNIVPKSRPYEISHEIGEPVTGMPFGKEKVGYMPSLGAGISHLGAGEIVGSVKPQKISPGVKEIPTGGLIPSPLQQRGDVFPSRGLGLMRIQPRISTMGERVPLGRLIPFLNDPAVLGIECPGAGKNLLVHKFGAIQTTSVVLVEDEINEIMKNISERTRIPIIQGVFKAALDNIIVTAVVSEFVGTRFYIEKMRAQNMQYGRYGFMAR